jgi:hypothetical protein
MAVVMGLGRLHNDDPVLFWLIIITSIVLLLLILSQIIWLD